MKKTFLILSFFIAFVILIQACRPDEKGQPGISDVFPDTAYNFVPPPFFPVFVSPANNPLTKRGVELGRMLFYDPILSKDSSISCASCHKISNSFADTKKFSEGVNGAQGVINSMPLVNLAWQNRFFWNGRAMSLEQQALDPINNPLEMHETSLNVVNKLKRHPSYPKLFRSAFGSDEITPEMVAKALSQFERIIVSNKSTFDRVWQVGLEAFRNNPKAQAGYQLFFDERGQCFHCHGAERTFLAHNLDTIFRNNGLLSDAQMRGKGLSEVTGKASDDGMFKVPSLRNIELTAPYMHDGRFSTLEEVMDFYSSGIHENANLDVNFTKIPERLEQFGGLGLTQKDKENLIAFLKTMTDTSFAKNPLYQNPFK